MTNTQEIVYLPGLIGVMPKKGFEEEAHSRLCLVASKFGRVLSISPRPFGPGLQVQYDQKKSFAANTIVELQNDPLFDRVWHVYRKINSGSGNDNGGGKTGNKQRAGAAGGGVGTLQYNGLPSGNVYASSGTNFTQTLVPTQNVRCACCGNSAGLVCICSTCYCSERCQQQDYPKHKDHCIPKLFQFSQFQAIFGHLFGQQQQQSKQQPQYQQQQQQQQLKKVQKNVGSNEQKNRVEQSSPQPTLEQSPEQTPEVATAKKVANVPRKGTITQGPFPKIGSKVKMSGTTDKFVFIYNSEKGENNESNPYMQYLMDIFGYEANQKLPFLSTAPASADIVLAPFDGDYYRAQVISVDGAEAMVNFTDFGNTETLAWSTIKELNDPELKWADCHVHPVKLNGIDQLNSTARKVLEKAIQLADEQYVLHDIAVDSKTKVKSVVLDLVGREGTLNNMVKAALQATPPKSGISDKSPKQNNDSEYKPLKMSNIKWSALDSKQPEIWHIIDSTMINSTKMISAVQKNKLGAHLQQIEQCKWRGGHDARPYTPQESSEICIVAKDGKEWCRGMKLSDDGDDYYLLDISENTTIDPANVRRYPSWLSREVYLHPCEVTNPEIFDSLLKGTVDRTPNELLRGLEILCMSRNVTEDSSDDTIVISIMEILNNC